MLDGWGEMVGEVGEDFFGHRLGIGVGEEMVGLDGGVWEIEEFED